MNALEEFYRFCYEHGGTLKAHKDFAYLHLKVATELKKALEYGNEWQRACQDRMREIEQLRAELATRKTVVMTEAEYKDYLSEQDRIKREAEEKAGRIFRNLKR